MARLFVNSANRNCGIHLFGRRVYEAILPLVDDYIEAYADPSPVIDKINQGFDTVIYSYNSTALPLANSGAVYTFPKHLPICLCHEQEPMMLGMIANNTIPDDWYGGKNFPHWIGHDPTITEETCRQFGNRVFSAPRPFYEGYLNNNKPGPGNNVFGSSGFGFPTKMHTSIVDAIQREYDEATIRFNMPPSHFGDPHLYQARSIAEQCRNIIRKPGIKLEISHDLLDYRAIIEWHQELDYSIYFYIQGDVPTGMRGVSSSVDIAMAAGRPIIVNNSSMFKHLIPTLGFYPAKSIHQIIEDFLSLNKVIKANGDTLVLNKYEEILKELEWKE